MIIGGRLGYVFFYNLDYYLEYPASIIQVWDGGMAFHGGFLGVVVAALIFCFSNRLSILSCADLIAVASPPGILLGRIANFINAELWGSPTSKPWGVVFPGERAQLCEGVVGVCARHPTQLYEGAMEGLFLFIFLLVLVFFGYLKGQEFYWEYLFPAMVWQGIQSSF